MKTFVIAGMLAALSAPVLAQTGGQAAHAGMGHGRPAQAGQGGMHAGMEHGGMMKNTAANPYAEAEMRMHRAMMAAQGADASETWVRKMIEHHRGAIDMSRVALAQAKDKEARDKAQKTIDSQTKEIAELQGWLKRHGKRAQ